MNREPAGSPERSKLVGRVRLRSMRIDDVGRVLAIELSLRDAPHWPRTAYLTAIHPEGVPHRVALVAENDLTRTVVGFAVAGLTGTQAELETVAVASDQQHQGIGSSLLSALIDHMKAISASDFILEVRASNHTALSLYRRLGWSQAGRRVRYYADPQEDAILMRLGLK